MEMIVDFMILINVYINAKPYDIYIYIPISTYS